MLKKNIAYKDFDNNPQTDTVYFNITKTELADNLDLRDEMLEIQTFFEGDQRDLSTQETMKILAFVKRIMKIAYGVKSVDGKKFSKITPDGLPLWNEFIGTMAYDTFLFSLFNDPQECFAFINGVLPAELVEEAQKMQGQQHPTLFNSDATSGQPVQEIPAWEREGRKPRPSELQTKEQIAYAMSKKMAS